MRFGIEAVAGSARRRASAAGLAACALTLASCAAAQQPVRSPEVQADGRVTFRLRDPNAKEVFLAREGAPRIAMTRDDNGVWSATTDALAPDYYGYSIVADGVSFIDPSNPLMKPNLLFTQSMVHVPGPPSLPWELRDVPRGTVHHHFYHSAVVGDDRDYYVYTPSGYDGRFGARYPVLYLLHGYSDDASGWTAVGRANVIMDNLIADGMAKPMLVVMPLGYGAPEIVSRGFGGVRDPNVGERNSTKFTEALLTEVIPQVERSYRVIRDRNSRAIAGLSMGGGESLTTGLNHLDVFGWVASFSGAILQTLSGSTGYDAVFPTLGSDANGRLHTLWIACGTEDGLVQANRRFEQWLDGKGIHYTRIETPGQHTWMVWRRNLAAFAPLLFRSGTASTASR